MVVSGVGVNVRRRDLVDSTLLVALSEPRVTVRRRDRVAATLPETVVTEAVDVRRCDRLASALTENELAAGFDVRSRDLVASSLGELLAVRRWLRLLSGVGVNAVELLAAVVVLRRERLDSCVDVAVLEAVLRRPRELWVADTGVDVAVIVALFGAGGVVMTVAISDGLVAA